MSYPTLEEENRVKANLLDSLAFVKEQTGRDDGVTYGIKPEKLVKKSFCEQSQDPPDSFDFRNRTPYSTPIKSQGHCASCWAHAAVITFEYYFNAVVPFPSFVPFSVQQIIDCVRKPNFNRSDGCIIGYPIDALVFIRAMGGLYTEANYPYVAPVSFKFLSFQYNCE